MFLITLVFKTATFFPSYYPTYGQGWLTSLKINTVGELFLRQPTAVPSSPTYPYVQVTNSNSFFALR